MMSSFKRDKVSFNFLDQKYIVERILDNWGVFKDSG